MMNTPRPSSIFTGLPLPCIISLEGYNREGLGTRINHSHFHPFQLNATTFVDLMSCTRLYQTQGTGNNASSFVVRFNPGLDYRRLVQATNFPTKADSHSERVGLHEIGLLGLDQSTLKLSFGGGLKAQDDCISNGPSPTSTVSHSYAIVLCKFYR